MDAGDVSARWNMRIIDCCSTHQEIMILSSCRHLDISVQEREQTNEVILTFSQMKQHKHIRPSIIFQNLENQIKSSNICS